MMIDPKSVEPDRLPSFSLANAKRLPSLPGVYFAIKNGEVLYVGKSKNLKRRWRNHQKAAELERLQGVYVAYMPVPEAQLRQVEEQLIQSLSPRLNQCVSTQKNLSPRETVYDSPKKRREVTVTAEGWQGFKDLAKRHNVSASELVEQLGRGILTMEEPEGDD